MEGESGGQVADELENVTSSAEWRNESYDTGIFNLFDGGRSPAWFKLRRRNCENWRQHELQHSGLAL